MSLQSFNAPRIILPMVETATSMESPGGSVTLDAVGEKCFYVGQVCLEDGSGSKTLSSSGGKILWRTSTVTWATSGSTIRVGIQDVHASSGPAQGDGTYDVYKDLVQGTDSLANSTNYATAMGSGSKSLSHGQHIAIGWECTARNGADSVTLAYGSGSTTRPSGLYPTFTSYLSSTWARVSNTPLCSLEFDDGTVGWILNGTHLSAGSSSQVYNSGTGTADEYGNAFTFPVPVLLEGVVLSASLANTSSDFEICLYKTPLGTPSLVEAITFHAVNAGATATPQQVQLMFSSPRRLEQSVEYGITVRPISSNSVTIYTRDWPAKNLKLETLGENCYAIRRLDNTGAFSEFNGGTSKTRRMSVHALMRGFEDTFGDAGATYRIGM